MGEYADMAVDDALNGYWCDDNDWDDYEPGYTSRRRRRRRTNQRVFAQFKNYIPSLEEQGF